MWEDLLRARATSRLHEQVAAVLCDSDALALWGCLSTDLCRKPLGNPLQLHTAQPKHDPFSCTQHKSKRDPFSCTQQKSKRVSTVVRVR